MNTTAFGQKMKELRKKNGWTLDDLAERVGSTKQALSRYERGERVPKISDAKRISNAFGVQLAEMTESELQTVSAQAEMHAPLSPNVARLMEFVRTVPEEKADMILKVMQTILKDG